MKYIDCFLPDINFRISTMDKNYEILKNKIDESIIKFEKNCEKTIKINYVVDKNFFRNLVRKINENNGIIYDSFKNQKHKEIKLDNKYYYLVDSEEYVCIKISALNYKIIVEENKSNAANWVIRIIRELYLREKEDNKFYFMHGTGLEIYNKGILLLGNSGSGKTTLAVKLMELDCNKKFLSNDRIMLNSNMVMDYFPHAITYAMGTVKNSRNLEKYFKTNKILENKKKINYEDAQYDIDCNTPLTSVTTIFNSTEMVARTKLYNIIYPRFNKEFKDFEIIEMSKEEKKKLLIETCFTPNDTESLRKEWIRKRNITMSELVKNRDYLVDRIIEKVKINKIKYGPQTNVEKILKKLLEE